MFLKEPVLARAKREAWTQQIATAKQAIALLQSNAISPLQSIAAVMQERGERYRERIANVSEKVAGHLESLDADEILCVAHKSRRSTLWHVALSDWIPLYQAAGWLTQCPYRRAVRLCKSIKRTSRH